MSTIFQVTGVVAITIGALLLSIPAGLIVAGIFGILIGLSLGNK
jgi:hypothetical protein